MNQNILIIEPSKDLAKVLSEALKQNGMKARLAYDAQSAIHKADRETPDCIIMELIMPKHNGLEFVHELRSYPEWLNIPIIIYSQLSLEELGLDKKLLTEMGIIEYFYKPTTSLKKLVAAAEASFAQINN